MHIAGLDSEPNAIYIVVHLCVNVFMEVQVPEEISDFGPPKAGSIPNGC